MSSLWDNLATMIGSNTDLVSRLLEAGSEAGLLEDMLKPTQRGGREMMALALTGRLRSDAGTLTQSAKNAKEGKTIAELAQTGSSGVSEALKTMSAVAARVAANGNATDADKVEYDNALDTVKSLIANTSYNGINLMDGKTWASDERLSVSGDTARIGIRMGAMSRSMVLYDFSAMGNMADAATALASTADAEAARDLAARHATRAGQFSTAYKGVAAGFESSAKVLDKQSGIMDRAAQRSIYGAKDDSLSRLMSYLLSEQGNIVNRSS